MPRPPVPTSTSLTAFSAEGLSKRISPLMLAACQLSR
jgi:hypothetical protein